MRDPIVDDLIDLLATYRLTRLVVSDEITQPAIEHVAGAVQAAWGTPAREWFDRLTSCAWCASVWIAAGVVTARAVAPRAWAPVARLLAFSAVAGMIARED